LEVEIAGEVAVGHMGLVDHPRRDEALVLAVDWRVLATPAGDRSFTLHLVDPQGHVWSQADDAGYIAAEWRKGDRARQWFELALDRAMPPGSYQARLMLLDAEGARLPVRLPEGIGDAMPVAEVRIGPDGRARAEAGRAVHSLFGATSEVAEATGGAMVEGKSERGITADGPGALALLDVAVDARIAPSGTLSLELLWARSGEEPPPDGLSDWILEARRVTSAAEELTSSAPEERAAVQPRILDRQPIAPGYPPSLWARRELLRGRYALQAPGDLDTGDHDLVLRVGEGPAALIGRVTVDTVARRFETPEAMDVTLDALGSDHLRLLGLDLEPRPLVAGEPFTVTLWWRAESTTDARYKVFVHLDRSDGHLLAQDDSEPAQATRPTSGWLPGEVVADPHRIAPPIGLPAGDYVLGIGLYDPVSGARLSLTDDKGKAVPEDKLRLPIELR
jgi:hypothetical protein